MHEFRYDDNHIHVYSTSTYHISNDSAQQSILLLLVRIFHDAGTGMKRTRAVRRVTSFQKIKISRRVLEQGPLFDKT
jgi:hypothetical protein